MEFYKFKANLVYILSLWGKKRLSSRKYIVYIFTFQKLPTGMCNKQNINVCLICGCHKLFIGKKKYE